MGRRQLRPTLSGVSCAVPESITRVEQGMKPELARLTMARKLAALTLVLWKKGEPYNPEKLIMQAA